MITKVLYEAKKECHVCGMFTKIKDLAQEDEKLICKWCIKDKLKKEENEKR